jgi:ribosomal protein S18 acetylase RimI-like enzyme
VESVSVRKAKASELDEIVRMHLSLQEHLEGSNSSIWRYTEDKKRSLKQQYAKHLQDENSLVLVVRAGAKTVGLLLATVSHRTEYVPSVVGSLSSIYVGENHRRRGIGSRLIKEAGRLFLRKKAEHV